MLDTHTFLAEWLFATHFNFAGNIASTPVPVEGNSINYAKHEDHSFQIQNIPKRVELVSQFRTDSKMGLKKNMLN